MKHLFQVKIKYAEGTRSEYNIAAFTDVQARKLAIELDSKIYREGGSKQPRIDYCETTHISGIDVDIEKPETPARKR